MSSEDGSPAISDAGWRVIHWGFVALFTAGACVHVPYCPPRRPRCGV